ncbi:hypothetical protein E2C01_034650 [Portunus trituberculatus]|uniref:Uncharacterized protein n=1 Tax=Portunus trituberculatus TaxID=210409 RepID=A0A5B7F766_PORTR|nr:hypothetical protein [Portunus trituberculatus]
MTGLQRDHGPPTPPYRPVTAAPPLTAPCCCYYRSPRLTVPVAEYAVFTLRRPSNFAVWGMGGLRAALAGGYGR